MKQNPTPEEQKEDLIKEAKQIRKDLDDVLQRMKEHRTRIADASLIACKDPSEVMPNHILSIRKVEDAIMRQGMALKAIGNPNPYPDSYNPESTAVEPTADGLKL